ncbi:MAG TPA: hypothetical protein VK855_07220 [Thioalkalivibrio sp.]|nr:hypothetical protein [Thioalkalivibrio sp.]
MNRIGGLLAALALTGCGVFYTTVDKPDLLPAHDEQRTAIEVGKTKRAEEKPYRHDCKLMLTAEFAEDLPAEWAGRGIALWRNGNGIAANQRPGH